MHDFPPVYFFWLDTTNRIYRSLHLMRLMTFRILWKRQNTIITCVCPSYKQSPGQDTTHSNTTESHLDQRWPEISCMVYSTETSTRTRVETILPSNWSIQKFNLLSKNKVAFVSSSPKPKHFASGHQRGWKRNQSQNQKYSSSVVFFFF